MFNVIRIFIRAIVGLTISFVAILVIGGGLLNIHFSEQLIFDLIDEYSIGAAPEHLEELKAAFRNIAHALSNKIGPPAEWYIWSGLAAGATMFAISAVLFFQFLTDTKEVELMGPQKIRDPLFENKFVASILVSALILFGAPLLAAKSLSDDNNSNLAENESPPASAEQLDDVKKPSEFSELVQSSDPARGERRAALCGSCHTFYEGEEHRIGPNLWGVVGREVAAAEGFTNYSTALKNKGGDWTIDELEAFLKAPAQYAPGTIMTMPTANETHRAEIIRYLQTLTDK